MRFDFDDAGAVNGGCCVAAGFHGHQWVVHAVDHQRGRANRPPSVPCDRRRRRLLRVAASGPAGRNERSTARREKRRKPDFGGVVVLAADGLKGPGLGFDGSLGVPSRQAAARNAINASSRRGRSGLPVLDMIDVRLKARAAVRHGHMLGDHAAHRKPYDVSARLAQMVQQIHSILRHVRQRIGGSEGRIPVGGGDDGLDGWRFLGLTHATVPRRDCRASPRKSRHSPRRQ